VLKDGLEIKFQTILKQLDILLERDSFNRSIILSFCRSEPIIFRLSSVFSNWRCPLKSSQVLWSSRWQTILCLKTHM